MCSFSQQKYYEDVLLLEKDASSFLEVVGNRKHIDLFQRRRLYERCFLFRLCVVSQLSMTSFSKIIYKKKPEHCFIWNLSKSKFMRRTHTFYRCEEV